MQPFTALPEKENLESSQLSKIIHFLLEKYSNIIETEYHKDLSIEKIFELITTYYESIISCMPGNVFWLDKNCITVGCNKNVLYMFGFKSMAEFKGLNFEEMGQLGSWSPEATEKFKRDTLEVLHSGQAKLNAEEPPIPHADGKIIHFLTTRVPLFDNDGDIIGVVGISIDITERKQMEEELRQAKEVAETALKAKEMAEKQAREKSVSLQNVLTDLKSIRYYLTGKYEGIYLTKREAECIICLARGYTAKQTASTLKISPKTVEACLENLKVKLRCRDKATLISIAIECEFLEGIRPSLKHITP